MDKVADSDTLRETVNTLAARAKTDQTAVPELWGATEDLIKMICRRYCCIPEHDRPYEDADIYQIAAMGFLKAVGKFDPSKGAFSTILGFYVRSSCQVEIKKYYRPKSDPINAAVSLDKPLDGAENFTLADALPDPHAHEFIEEISNLSVAQVILDESDKMANPLHIRIIQECLYRGRTLTSLADELGISKAAASDAQRRALLQLRHRSVIRALTASLL